MEAESFLDTDTNPQQRTPNEVALKIDRRWSWLFQDSSTWYYITLLVDQNIHKPCTDNCGGLIEPVTNEKHVDLVRSVADFWRHNYKAYFVLEVPISDFVGVYCEQTFLILITNCQKL